MKRDQKVKKMVLLAMLAAISYMMVSLVRIPIFPAAPFLKYEPKDVIITIGGFALGPLASFIVSILVSLIEMVTISETGPIGALMNLISTCSFACTAALVYKKKRTLFGAILGLAIGAVTMVCTMLLWNWLITPLYQGVSRDVVAAMLLPIFLPFNLLKAGLNTAFVLTLYKPLVLTLREAGLVAPQENKRQSKIGVYILAAGLLITCVVLILVIRGSI